MAEACPHKAAVSPLDILIATPDPDLAHALRAAIKALGHRGFWVMSGGEAALSATARRFDLILLDADTRDDAFSAARRIRALPDTQGSAPIAAIAARADQALRDRAAEAGLDAVLEKERTPALLGQTIALLT